ncbi:hypothetical protein ABAZ39_02245 [Azospirillum argentinense]|uniref:GGDEF domain-containing protein n=1 Tax=Azospirillum argentinense TaxID=2970906 RepID=A0A060DIN3_9PROT|nr:hypothetical protein [Azospirillum argentinense]AIB10858.1 hypothetical protein ABAZ39_02245 [Azospirillum argentinense]EZQ07828.1 hypothetical protein ABAZ39_03670 [Azospirillum argentinense]MBK3800174.1 hypothetical protein [Azospirillum argentinense]PNR00126.1 hypothetical protein C1S70_04630 [Azospirillum argentinense]
MNAVQPPPSAQDDHADRTGIDPPCHCDGAAKAADCQSSCHLNDAAFRDRAKEILFSGRLITAGAVHLIGLEDIRNQLGNRWERVKERVHIYTTRLLEKMLSPHDVWFRHGEAQFIIVFAHADIQAAQLICGKIVEDLHQSLLGHSDTSQIIVKTALVEIDGSVAVGSARLDDLLLHAASPSERPSAKPQRAGRPEERSEERQRPSLTDFALGNGEPPPRPKVLFRPVYDVRNKVISTYTCRPDLHTCRHINQITADDVMQEEAIFDYDMETLCHAVRTYNELYQNKFRYAQTIPVHFETLASVRRRREYLQSCRMIPNCLIPFLAFELEGLPQGIPNGRLAEMVTMLRPFGRAAIVILREENSDIATYANAGVKGVGLAMDFRDGDQRCIDKINAFCPIPRKHGLFAYLDGIRNVEQFQAAIEAGAAYVGGAVVGKDSDVPEHMRRCTERQMLMRARVKARRESA